MQLEVDAWTRQHGFVSWYSSVRIFAVPFNPHCCFSCMFYHLAVHLEEFSLALGL